MQGLEIERQAGISCFIGVSQTPKKPKAKPTGVSLFTMDEAKARAKELGFQNFSSYIAALVHKDLHTPGGWLTIPPKRPKK